MFWALDERRKWRAQWRAAAIAEGLALGRTEGQAAGRAETRQQYDARLAKVAQKRGIPLDDLIPPNRDAE